MDANTFEKLAEENRLFGHVAERTFMLKKEYLRDLYNISDSFVGQIDTMFLNAFLQESESLIINSIALYEKGYYDCACYSLRQALELSDCMVYFAEQNAATRQEEFAKWNKSEYLDARKVGNFLNNLADNYKKTKTIFRTFFNKKNRTKLRLNTIVHKQGLDMFYSFRRNMSDSESKVEAAMFGSFVKTAIAYIAILRLVVDPFPILLSDEEIYYRLPGLMTEPYTLDFVHRYIGKRYIEQYKTTSLYTGYYDGIVESHDKKNPAIANLIAHKIIDDDSVNDYAEQAHLLGAQDMLALKIALISPKIAKLHIDGYIIPYHTNTLSARGVGFDSCVVRSYKRDESTFNQKYDNAYMSFLGPTELEYSTFDKEDFSLFVEHNIPFTDDEICLLESHYTEAIEGFKKSIENIYEDGNLPCSAPTS